MFALERERLCEFVSLAMFVLGEHYYNYSSLQAETYIISGALVVFFWLNLLQLTQSQLMGLTRRNIVY